MQSMVTWWRMIDLQLQLRCFAVLCGYDAEECLPLEWWFVRGSWAIIIA